MIGDLKLWGSEINHKKRHPLEKPCNTAESLTLRLIHRRFAMSSEKNLIASIFTPRMGYRADAEAIELPASSGKPMSVTYSELAALIDGVKAQLASLHLKKGTVICSSLVNSLEFVVVFLATAALGLVAAPLNPNYKENEVSFYLEDTNTPAIIVPNGTLAEKNVSEGALSAARAAKSRQVRTLEIVHDVPTASRSKSVMRLVDQNGSLPTGEATVAEEDDTALILHTSGTTGRPKAVPLTHKNLLTSMHNIQKTYELSPNDKTFLVMPLFHVHGLICALLSSLLACSSVVIPPRFSASTFWPEFVQTKSNWYTAVPTIHQILLASEKPDPMPKLRFVRSCSSSLSPATLTSLEQLVKAPVLEAYAMTEAAHQMTSNPLPPKPHKAGTVGFGHGVEVKILNEKGEELPVGQNGEVCVRGSNVTNGYIDNEKANQDNFFRLAYNNCLPDVDGFLRTGDQGRMDDDGYLILAGRIKELINRSGEKISPLEVDNALLSLPYVKEAVSFGIPDDMYDELVGAVIVPEPGAAHPVDQAKVQSDLSANLVKFKIPSRVWITDSIPKTYVAFSQLLTH